VEANLATVERQIIDVIPRELQTAGNIEWVKSELAVNTPAMVLDDVKRYLEASNSEVVRCKSQLEQMGVDLYSHIRETRQKFNEVDDRISKLETRLEVAEKIADIRYESQKEINRLTSERQNSADQNTVLAAGNRGYFYDGYSRAFSWAIVFLFGMPVLLVLISLLPVNRQSPQVQSAPVQRGY
jgi:DNA-binding transcriptional regulator GbsR (MarR family)